MSTITASVTTNVSAIPLLRHRDTVVNFPADQDDFVAKYEATNDHLSTSTVSEINDIGDEINVVIGQINTVAGEVNTNAGIATTQAGIATTQAGLADTARIAAELAKTQAEAIYDNFDDRYLGAKTVAPTLDNDGNALTSGAIYYNSVSDTMFVYDLELASWIALTFTPTDHGSLTGLADDDHTQYHNDTRGDARYLKLAGGSLTGELLATSGATIGGDLAFTQIDKGTVSTGTVTFTQSDGNVQKLTVGGSLTIATTGWHTTGSFSDLLIQLVNGGSATVTMPTINWVNPDGTVTTTMSTYMTAISRTAFQTSGVDFIYLWTVDGGTTIYGKLV